MAIVWARKAFRLSLADKPPIPAIFCKADRPVLADDEADVEVDDCPPPPPDPDADADELDLPFPGTVVTVMVKGF